MPRIIVAALLLFTIGCASGSKPEPWIELVSATDYYQQLHVRLDRSGQGQIRIMERGGWSSIQLQPDDLASIERILEVERFDALGSYPYVFDAGYKSIKVRRGDRVKEVRVTGAGGPCHNADSRHFARIWNVLVTVTAPEEETGMDLAWRKCAES